MMNKRISLFILIVLTLSLFGSSPKPVNAVTWWNNNWSYKMKLTINATKVDADLTDFPVLVYLNSSRIDWTHVQDDLDDLRFIDGDDITQLYAELENYTVNNEAWIWVKIPAIYVMGIPEEGNQKFYLYYGNNAVSSWWNPEDVWEASAVMVQHMADDPDNAHIMDSTQYDNDGTKKGANEPIETINGEIDSAQSFDGINDWIDCGKAANLDFVTQSFSLMCWVYPTNISNWLYLFDKISWSQYGYAVQIYPAGFINFGISYEGGYKETRSYAGDITLNNWFRVVATRNGAIGKVYINGIDRTSSSPALPDLGSSINRSLGIGGTLAFLEGIEDEVRIYNIAQSAEWILADYYSGSDNLLIYGAESLGHLSLTVRYNIGINKLYINDTQIANNTTIYIDQNTTVNATAISQSNYIFYRHILGLSGVSLIPMYLFNMTQPFTLWSYATPNFYIYEEPTTFTFSQWMILLFVALGISLLAAIKFHIIATVSLILVLYMVINVASYTGMILLAIIVWLLTIMFSIIAFAEI